MCVRAARIVHHPRVRTGLDPWLDPASLRSWCQLEDDPTEHVDLSPRHADLAYELAAELAKLNATLFEPVRGTPSLEACLRGIDEGRYYGPWAHVPDGWYTPVPPPSANQRAKDDFLRSTLTHLNKPLPSQLLVKCAPPRARPALRARRCARLPLLSMVACSHAKRCASRARRSMYVGVPLMSFNIIFPTIDTCRSNKSCDSRLPFWPCSWPF